MSVFTCWINCGDRFSSEQFRVVKFLGRPIQQKLEEVHLRVSLNFLLNKSLNFLLNKSLNFN